MSATERLRERTRALHERVEQATDLERRARTRAGYADMLRRIGGCLRAIEPMLERFPWSELGIVLAERRRLPLVEQDLRWLGESEAPPVVAMQPPGDLAEALGVLYVLEGSTLGGQLILRTVARELGLDGEHGGSYFHGHGARTGTMWKDLKARADAWCGTDEVRFAHALAGAERAFAAFEQAFASR